MRSVTGRERTDSNEFLGGLGVLRRLGVLGEFGLLLLAFGDALLELALRLAKRLREIGYLLRPTEEDEGHDNTDHELPRTDVLKKRKNHLYILLPCLLSNMIPKMAD